jgi:hypothetical protein
MIPVLIKLRGDLNELKGRVADLEAKVMELHDRLYALEGGPPNNIGTIEPPPTTDGSEDLPTPPESSAVDT